jgi:hypothetical protein
MASQSTLKNTIAKNTFGLGTKPLESISKASDEVHRRTAGFLDSVIHHLTFRTEQSVS